MILIAFLFYYTLGFFLTNSLFKKLPSRLTFYTLAFVISGLFLIIYDYISINILNLSTRYSIPSLFYKDEDEYHFAGVQLANNLFISIKHLATGYTFLWQYIIGANYTIFGINPVFPKIFNIFIFSISSIAIYDLAYKLSISNSIAKRCYFLFVFYIPLLYMNATLLRDSFISSLVILIFYFFTKYTESKRKSAFLWLILCLIFLLFTRFEYAIILTVIIIFTIILSKEKSLIKRLLPAIVIILLGIFLLSTNLVQNTGIYEDIFGGGKARTMWVSSQTGIRVEEGIFAMFYNFISNPFDFSKMLMFGTIQFILTPLPYLWLTSEVYNNKEQYDFFVSFYNMAWYTLLPAIYFGIKLKFKFKAFKIEDFVILLAFIIIIIAVSVTNTSITRYRLPFLPPLLFYASYGIEYFSCWKNRIGYIFIIYIALFIVFRFAIRTADIIQ